MQRLVLDLRGNGGGRIDEARRIAGEFLPRGSVIYTASGRKAEVNDTARVERSFWSSERRYPIVLLVDEGTASASELIAGALQDHDRATIVGRTTFGKSLIMQTFPLTDGSRMSLVIGQLRTPCGRIIQREYRGTSRREYYREAGQSAHADAPSCRTDGGRVVYGGGGIVPDVELAQTSTPVWLARASELALLATWAAGYVDSHQNTLTTIDAVVGAGVLDAATLASFRTYSASAGLTIPDDPESSSRLSAALLRTIAYAKFGESGYYHLVALTDPDVQAAARAFDGATVGKE
jgi:carboxyl-terminal processing protease